MVCEGHEAERKHGCGESDKGRRGRTGGRAEKKHRTEQGATSRWTREAGPERRGERCASDAESCEASGRQVPRAIARALRARQLARVAARRRRLFLASRPGERAGWRPAVSVSTEGLTLLARGQADRPSRRRRSSVSQDRRQVFEAFRVGGRELRQDGGDRGSRRAAIIRRLARAPSALIGPASLEMSFFLYVFFSRCGVRAGKPGGDDRGSAWDLARPGNRDDGTRAVARMSVYSLKSQRRYKGVLREGGARCAAPARPARDGWTQGEIQHDSRLSQKSRPALR